MGSYSQSSSSTSAIDKRQVISENAVGYTVDGNSNTFGNEGLSNISMSGSELNFNTLDGGVINRAFDFASNSLSQMIALTIDRDKVAEASASQVTDSAMEQIGQIGQTAAAAATQATGLNKWMLIGGALVLVYVVWSKK